MKKYRIFLLIASVLLLFSGFSHAGDEYTPLRVFCGGNMLDTGYEYHGNLYISLEDFLTYGETEKLSINTASNKICFDPADLELSLADGPTTDFIQQNAGELHVFMRPIGSGTFVPLKILSQFSGLEYVRKGNDLYLYPQYSAGVLYTITKDTDAAASLLDGSGRTVSLKKGQLCRVEESGKAFSKLHILYGDTVWVMNDCFARAKEDVSIPDFIYLPRTKTDYSGRKINMAWDDNPGGAPDPGSGVDVICAFNWFRMEVGKDGYIGTDANIGYTDTCHENGYEVWATITNSFQVSGSTKYTTEVLADEALRNKTIAQYLFYAMIYNVDGLNIDYEDLVAADKKNLTAFVETMSEYTNRMGITLSIATLVPESWNFSIYEYEYLGRLADFITVMAYDEHYSASSGPGSTSSKGWYTRNLETLTKITDSRKILFGIPFYSFINKYNGGVFSSAKWSWKTTGSYLEKAEADGRILSAPVWKENDGQYYVEYVDTNGSTVYKIWLEDERSVMTRIKTVYDLDLGGTACWEMDQAASYAVFDLFDRTYHKGEDPDDILLTFAQEAE